MATDAVSQGPAGGGLYRFRPLSAADLPRLAGWLAEPHVRAWWGEPADEIATIERFMALGREAYLVEARHRPIAYLQTCDIAGEPEADWPGQPPGTWAIDTFIGPPEAVGRGHGAAYLQQIGDRLLARPAVARLTVDPDPGNDRAIRAYEKAGFVADRRVARPQGEALLMIRERR